MLMNGGKHAMLLSAEIIKKLILDPDVGPKDKLYITPVLDWDLQAKPGNCSIDVRLGQTIRVPRRAKIAKLDHVSDEHEDIIARYKDDHYIPIGDYFVLHPRQFVLGETFEWIHLPRGFAAYVVGRSSWGRDGLVVATAIGVHAGYSGVLTLELSNIGEIPICLYPGLTIAQLFINRVEHDPQETAFHRSTYSGSTSPSGGSAAGQERKIIQKFGDRLKRKSE